MTEILHPFMSIIPDLNHTRSKPHRLVTMHDGYRASCRVSMWLLLFHTGGMCGTFCVAQESKRGRALLQVLADAD
jgi:hypothetical protein